MISANWQNPASIKFKIGHKRNKEENVGQSIYLNANNHMKKHESTPGI